MCWFNVTIPLQPLLAGTVIPRWTRWTSICVYTCIATWLLVLAPRLSCHCSACPTVGPRSLFGSLPTNRVLYRRHTTGKERSLEARTTRSVVHLVELYIPLRVNSILVGNISTVLQINFIMRVLCMEGQRSMSIRRQSGAAPATLSPTALYHAI